MTAGRPRKPKTIVVGVRLPETEYQFLRDIANEMSKEYEVTVSQLAKMMIDYFIMAFSLGELKTPLKTLRRRFADLLQKVTKKQGR